MRFLSNNHHLLATIVVFSSLANQSLQFSPSHPEQQQAILQPQEPMSPAPPNPNPNPNPHPEIPISSTNLTATKYTLSQPIFAYPGSSFDDQSILVLTEATPSTLEQLIHATSRGYSRRVPHRDHIDLLLAAGAKHYKNYEDSDEVRAAILEEDLRSGYWTCTEPLPDLDAEPDTEEEKDSNYRGIWVWEHPSQSQKAEVQRRWPGGLPVSREGRCRALKEMGARFYEDLYQWDTDFYGRRFKMTPEELRDEENWASSGGVDVVLLCD